MNKQRFQFILFALLVGTLRVFPSNPNDELATLQETFRQVHRFVLDNGMVGLIREDHSAPVAALQIWVNRGSIHEGQWMGAGLSHFVEHMIFKGTPTRAPGDISREISDLGGDLNAYTTLDRTVFHVTLPSRHWTNGLTVLADAVMNASFPAEEWAREREVILREFAMHKDNPDREINRLLWDTAFRVHPYRIPVIGYEDVFTATTRDDLAAYFHQHYLPKNMIVVLVGDVLAADAESRIREAFREFARRAEAPMILPAEPPQMAPRTARASGPYEVSRLRIAWPTVAMSHSNAPALDVLSAIVGSGRSSRLVAELKENKKLVYGIDAWSFTPEDPGLFGISATFEPGLEEDVIRAIEEEVSSWSRMPFTEEELAKARRQVLVQELSSLEDMGGQAASYASGEFYAGDPGFSVRYLEQVMAVDAKAVRDAAERYLKPERRTLVTLSPADAVAAGPVSPEASVLPEVTRQTLSNGIPLIVREDHRLPFAYLCVALRGGLLSETDDRVGITPLLAELLTRGNNGLNAAQLAEEVDSRGGSLSSFSGWNSFGLQARCLSRDVPFFIQQTAACLLTPTLPADELEKQRALQLAAIRQQREQPMFIAQEKLQALLFPGHPYRWMSSGTPETVAAITRDDLEAYLSRHRVAGNIALAVFGDVKAETARELAEKYFGSVPPGEPPPPPSVPPTPVLPARAEQTEPRQQTILLTGFPGMDVLDPRSDTLSVLQDVLSGLSSDLGLEVRDRRGLAYFVGATDRQGLQPGLFTLYAGVRPDTLAETERLMAEQIQRLRETGPREDEFRRAIEGLIAGHQMSLQNNQGLAQLCALKELYGLGYRHALDLEDRLRALTAEQVREAARAILDPARQAVSIVRPDHPSPGGPHE